MDGMMEIVSKTISDILAELYSSFWYSVVLSVFFMFVYQQYASIKKAIRQWLKWFESDSEFRRMFLLVFYSVMIIFRTLLNRNMWLNPLSNVIGFGLTYVNKDGQRVLNREAIENFLLFIPFMVLVFWRFREKLLGTKVKFLKTLWKSVKVTFIFSFVIEMMQLFLRLGTWQISDLIFNTAGGLIGGLIYFIVYKISCRNQKSTKQQIVI